VEWCVFEFAMFLAAKMELKGRRFNEKWIDIEIQVSNFAQTPAVNGCMLRRRGDVDTGCPVLAGLERCGRF
jgi:hypothetical protein